MRHRLDVGEQRMNPLMQGRYLVTLVPMHCNEVSYGGFEFMVNLAADDMLIKKAGGSGLLAVEVHSSSGAQTEQQQTHEHRWARYTEDKVTL